MKNLDALFDDKRVLCLCIACWTTCVAIIFVCIMIDDHSPFLSFGPNDRTVLFGVKVDSWTKWGCIAMYTFVSTCIADFTSDSVGPFVTNTIQDHKNLYIPYSKATCVLIVQVFAVYAIVMNTIGLFVALSQVDFMMIRMFADLMVNYYTCHRFMRYKSVNEELYSQYIKSHCVDAVHYSTDVDIADGSSYCSTEATTPPLASTPQKAARSASPVAIAIRRAASVSVPCSDDFDGMPRLSPVPVPRETFQLYGTGDSVNDRLVAYDKKNRDSDANTFVVHSPRESEHEKSKLITAQHS